MKYLKELLTNFLINLEKRIKIYKDLLNKNESEYQNIKIYELTPSININDNTYLDYLISALDKNDIKNIALSGPYGSGKSSILKALKKRMSNNSNYKFLSISLATFKGEDENISLTLDEYVAIEKSILQQMFYSVEQSKIPNSRFKRIKFDKNLSRNSFFFTLWIISIVELFSPYTFIYHYFNYFDLTIILSIIFGIGFIKFGKVIYESTSNIKLSKFIIQNQEVSFDSDKQTSILNANIDEILYFFNTTNYNVMIIEDLDRFNNLEIFIKLREINTLLNNGTNDKKITFIYAIKDDMFKNKDRTKFFDYIIPVVPFINSSNSSKKLIELLKEEDLLNKTNENNSNKVNERFIKDISIYINDMRFLINVFNEFVQYTHKLAIDIELDFNSLFAISLYKNYKPDDFAKLHNDEGILYTLFSQKYKNMILDDITKKLKDEIEELTNKIDKINSLTVQRIEELRSLYIFNLMNFKNHIISHIYVEGSQIQTIELIKNHFETFSNERNNIFYIFNGHRIDSDITFSGLGKLVDENYTYEEKKAAIELRNTTSIEELKIQRETKQNKLSKIRAKSINELLNMNEIEETITINKDYLSKCLFGNDVKDVDKIDILKDDLLMYLLRYGYIKEDYFKYISYYHPGQETPTDINFILNIQKNGNPLNYDLELTHFEYIFNELNSENYFSKDAILNYSLINTLLNKKEFVNQFKILDSTENTKYSEVAIDNIIKLLLPNLKKYFDFIDTYIDNYNDSSILERKVWWISNLWEFIMMNKDFSIEKKDKYFYLIFELNEKNKALKLLEAIDKNNQLSQYIINKKSFINFVNKIRDFESFIEFLKSKGLTFKKLDDIDYKSEKFNTIYENNLYRINFEWISKILHSNTGEDLKSKNYTSILSSGKEKLIEYIHKNINLYVEDILLIHGNLEDDEKDIIELLNNEELKNDNKIIIIDRYKKTFNDISQIIHFSWEELLKNNKIMPTHHNLKTCLESDIVKKYVKDFINLESTYSDIFNLPNKYDADEIETLKLESIIFDSGNINIETFEAFLKSINYKYEILPESLNHQFMQYMIELNKVETNPQNYQILIDRDFKELALKLIENNPKQFIQDIMSYSTIDNEIFIRLLKQNKFNDDEKISLLNILDINELLNYDEDNSFKEHLYNLKIKYFEKLNNDAFYELMKSSLSKSKKIELFIKYKFKDRDEVTHQLLSINSNFEKITQFSLGPILVRRDELNLKLLNKLKEINYISSCNDKNKEFLNVYTHRSEKEIILES